MSGNIELIRHETHGDKAWKRFSGYQFALSTAVAPLSAPEVAKAALSMPLALMQVEEKVSLVAVLGLHPQQNLFIAPDGRWVGSHVPAVFRGYPFKLSQTPSGDYSLCIDVGSGLLVEKGEGEALFNDDGTPSEAVREVMNFLVQTTKGLEGVNRAATALSEHGVLEPWPIKLKDGEQERSVTGLLRVNETALNALSDERFLALREVGALQTAFAQLLSMGNIEVLAKLSRIHEEIRQRQARTGQGQASFFDAKQDEQIDWNAIFSDEGKR